MLDILHQGRGRYPAIKAALASPDPFDALLSIGTAQYRDRVATLRSSMRTLEASGKIGQKVYEATTRELRRSTGGLTAAMKEFALVAALLAAACSAYDTPASPGGTPTSSPGTQIRVLMLTATAGFRHDSIGDARAAIGALGNGIQVTATEDLGTLTAASLSNFDVVFFALTSGELPLTPDQKAALLTFVANGGGFLGAHSATDTLYEWPEYGALVGAYFREHPWTQPGAVVVEDPSHPANNGVESRVTLNEEFYTFRDNPRPRVQVLLRLDPASVGASGDLPLAWAKSQGRGRVYYNALGHFGETWRHAQVQRQWRNAILWAAGR